MRYNLSATCKRNTKCNSYTNTLHFSILVALCIIFSSVTLLQDANATVPLVIITIPGGANDHNCGNTCFLPQNINVTRATAVMWVNKDLVPHDIVSGNPGDLDNGTLFDSGSIWIGKSFIYDFNNVGTFHYFDKSHPTETGTITVTDETNNANASSAFFYIDKKTYVKGDNILIYGSVGSYVSNTPVTIQILDNKNNSLLVSNTYPKPDDSFIVRIPTNNTEWKSGGPYDVKVQYGSVYIGDSTFVFYADQLSPLKQADAGVDYASITCDSGLVTIMKQEDGTVACVKPTSLQKLISLNWGYDSSEKLTVYGLKSIYKAGQEIDIKFRINAIGDPCGEPQITVKDSNQKIVWQSPQFSMSCQAGLQPYPNYQSEGSLGNNTSAPGYPMGLLIINQPGTYSLNILWWGENVTKEFAVIPQTSGNATSPTPSMPLNTYPQNNTGTVNIGNKTFYFTTLNDTLSSYHGVGAIPFTFSDVNFTLFPSVFSAGPPGSCGDTNFGSEVKFTDGTYERLSVHIPGQPCSENYTETVISNHQNPQAGVQVYQGKIRLLVNTQQTIPHPISNSSSNGPEYKVGPDLLGPIPHQLVFFMKSNSTAKIFVEYTSDEPNTGTVPSYSSVYLGNNGNFTPLTTTSDVTITADPPSIPMNQGSDTTVVYSITAKEGVKGVYWIFLVQFCRVMPLAIDINSLTISPSDIPVQTGMMSCPAQFLNGKILGISGGTAEYKIGQPTG